MSFTLNPNFLAQLERNLLPRGDAGTQVFAEQITENLEPGLRSGIHWPSLPRRSSAQNEHPQYQHGILQAGVFTERTGNLEWEVGIKDNPIGKLLALELGSTRVARRAPVARTLEDTTTQHKALEAMGGKAV